MNEFELIARLLPTLPTNPMVKVGAGDDCAVLDLGLQNQWVLMKTDAVVESIHFTRETQPQRIGHKALGRCLSDMAAMGGVPAHALVTLGLPKHFDVKRVEGIYSGINQLAQRHEVAIVGGEMTTNPEGLFISVSALGLVPCSQCVLRSGAKEGDAIFVTGTLGGSLEGKHLDFEPRVREARWLVEHFEVHAMIDLSDGLAGDLGHVLKASGVGAELLAPAIPVSLEARRRAQALGTSLLGSPKALAESNGHKTPLLAALTDGEDFELLFTLAGRHAVPLRDAWKQKFPELSLSCVGKIIRGSELLLRDARGVQPLKAHGYVHFSEPSGN